MQPIVVPEEDSEIGHLIESVSGQRRDDFADRGAVEQLGPQASDETGGTAGCGFQDDHRGRSAQHRPSSMNIAGTPRAVGGLHRVLLPMANSRPPASLTVSGRAGNHPRR
ncbi:hypothetical protein SDC9_198058 [bioreactor metagenome]|uniref:Uncharacterized protein n=1 Tax=bioreactor metagenome TaxID=1076179 RepID=A0A645IHW7_9ZZZZ